MAMLPRDTRAHGCPPVPEALSEKLRGNLSGNLSEKTAARIAPRWQDEG